MKTNELAILRGELLKLSELILEKSYPFCKVSDYHLSLAASQINDAAHKISKLAAEIPISVITS